MFAMGRANGSGDGRGWNLFRSCPDEAVLCAYVEDKVSGDERDLVEGHLSGCQACRDQIGFLVRTTDELPSATVPGEWLTKARNLEAPKVSRGIPAWQWATAGAAACALAVLMLWPGATSPPTPGPPVASRASEEPVVARSEPAPVIAAEAAPVVRSQVGAAQAPEPLVPRPHSKVRRESPTFRWKETPGALEYEVRLVNAEGDVLWEQRVERPAASVPPAVGLHPGAQYFLWIRAYLPGGRTVQSKAVPFTVAEP